MVCASRWTINLPPIVLPSVTLSGVMPSGRPPEFWPCLHELTSGGRALLLNLVCVHVSSMEIPIWFTDTRSSPPRFSVIDTIYPIPEDSPLHGMCDGIIVGFTIGKQPNEDLLRTLFASLFPAFPSPHVHACGEWHYFGNVNKEGSTFKQAKKANMMVLTPTQFSKWYYKLHPICGFKTCLTCPRSGPPCSCCLRKSNWASLAGQRPELGHHVVFTYKLAWQRGLRDLHADFISNFALHDWNKNIAWQPHPPTQPNLGRQYYEFLTFPSILTDLQTAYSELTSLGTVDHPARIQPSLHPKLT